MLQEFQVVGSSVLTLFLLMSVGFFFGKKGMLSDGTLSQMSRLLLYVVTVCIMLDVFAVERTPAVDRQLLTAAGGLLAVYTVYILLGAALYRRGDPAEGCVLRIASIYGNTGFMGLPLVQSVLGDEATMVAAMGVAFFNVVAWTHGVAVIGGRERASLRLAVLNPGVLGFLMAIFLYLTGFRLPGPVGTAVGYLGSLNTPLAMIVIGGQMASTGLGQAFREKRLYAACAVKLLVLPLLTVAVLWPFGVDRTVFMALVILAGCPTAGVTSLFCQDMGKDTALAARLIALSTVLCLLTLPLVAVLAQNLAG